MPRHATQVKQPTQAQIAARAAGAERLRAAALARSTRKVMPVRSTRQFIDVADETTGKPRAMKSRGLARESLEPAEIIVAQKMPSQVKADMLKHMEEFMTVMVHDTTDPTADPIPEIINGGDKNRQYFVRGLEQKVRRKYVEVLARMEITRYTQEKYKDANGDDAYRQIPHSVPRFPFTVIEDSEWGKEWLKRIRHPHRA